MGGPRRRPARTLASCDQGPSAPIPRLSCPSPAALGHAPGEEGIRRSEQTLQPCVRRPRAQGWEPQGLGEGASQRTQLSPAERRVGVGGGFRHLSSGLIPKGQPYLLEQSCTVTSSRRSRGCLVTGATPAVGPGAGLTGPVRGLPAALCRAPAGAPLPAPPSPAPGLSAPPCRLQLFRMRGGGPEGAGQAGIAPLGTRREARFGSD